MKKWLISAGIGIGIYLMLKQDKNKNFLSPSQVLSLIGSNEFNVIKKSHITPHFTWGEVFSHLTNEDIQTAGFNHLANALKLAQQLEQIRANLGNAPIVVTSWYRSPRKNLEVGGADGSEHKNGKAVDFVSLLQMPFIVQDKIEAMGWNGGMGKYSTFTHIDIGEFRRW